MNASSPHRPKLNAYAVQAGLSRHKQVKNVIAIASGKGGVGKSTVCINLACSLTAMGYRVGVLDADIYGPSQPTLTATSGKPESPDGKRITPHHAYGLQINSLGFIVTEQTALIWRGPMATQALLQLFNDTDWDDLDFLLLDLPPGTGDIQLTLAQKIPVAGAIMVTTPQDLSLIDVRRGCAMFEKVSVPVLGVVENMATYTCPQCGYCEDIFGHGAAQTLSDEFSAPVLGRLPLNIMVRQHADAGTPLVAAQPQHDISQQYHQIALALISQLENRPKDYSGVFGKIAKG